MGVPVMFPAATGDKGSLRFDIAAAKVRKRSVTIAGHRTSITIEDAFWIALKDIAGQREQTVAGLIAEVDGIRKTVALSTAIRVMILAHATLR